MPGDIGGMYVVINPEYIDGLRPRPRPGAVYQVIEVLPRNTRVKPLDGGPPVRINSGWLQPATEQQIAQAKNAANSAPPRYRCGAVVRWNISDTGRKADPMCGLGLTPRHPLIVTKEHPDGTVDLIPLGGTEKDTYWRKVPRQHLTAIPLDRISEFL